MGLDDVDVSLALFGVETLAVDGAGFALGALLELINSEPCSGALLAVVGILECCLRTLVPFSDTLLPLDL